MTETIWKVYILRCADGTLYTGIATDVARRVREHNAGTGAKYTRGRGPVELLYFREMGSRAQASREEWRIKQLTREEKLELIQQNTKIGTA